jgi:hypothetical protein
MTRMSVGATILDGGTSPAFYVVVVDKELPADDDGVRWKEAAGVCVWVGEGGGWVCMWVGGEGRVQAAPFASPSTNEKCVQQELDSKVFGTYKRYRLGCTSVRASVSRTRSTVCEKAKNVKGANEFVRTNIKIQNGRFNTATKGDGGPVPALRGCGGCTNAPEERTGGGEGG